MCVWEKTEICHFVHIIIHNILLVSLNYSLLFVEKNAQPYSLSPSACP